MPTSHPGAADASARPLPDLVYLDRFRNEGTRSYSSHAAYSEAEPAYRPEAGTGTVELGAYVLPRDSVNVYRANPDPALERTYLPDGGALFCIHPQVLAVQADEPYVRLTLESGTPAPGIRAAPSASTRTLYVQEHAYPHALKVHFPFRISRYGRRMRDEVVEQAVAVSGELEGWAAARGGDFAFLREVLGVTHRNLDADSPRGENWGYLVRDMRPFPNRATPGALLPGFALYGGDRFDPEAPPLLFALMDPQDPVAWILDNLMMPVIRHWVACFLELGFILEPHGQNVLLELETNMRVSRVVHRDLSVGIDMRRRRLLGLPDGGLNHYNRMEDGVFASIAYDKFMGGHFFDALLAPVLKAYPGLTPEDFREPCRAAFGRLFPEHAEWLPRTVQYFSEERDAFAKPLYLDTGHAPAWRP